MKKTDLGNIRITHRFRNGVPQVIRRFTKTQQKLIISEVKNKPDDMTIEDVLRIYEITPAVYYTKREKEKIFWTLLKCYPEFERGRKQVRDMFSGSPLVNKERIDEMLQQITNAEKENYELIKKFSNEVDMFLPEYGQK
jgi:hypothetical protein